MLTSLVMSHKMVLIADKFLKFWTLRRGNRNLLWQDKNFDFKASKNCYFVKEERETFPTPSPSSFHELESLIGIINKMKKAVVV